MKVPKINIEFCYPELSAAGNFVSDLFLVA
jgi:hypothetical protein